MRRQLAATTPPSSSNWRPQGQSVFRNDTFGDEALWTDKLRMHEVIGQAVSPTAALAVGLKVDAEALPAAVVAGIQAGTVDLTSPATTVALLKLNAVVGVKGTVESVNGKDTLTHVGITCALCHSTVDDSFAPGIGKRLDGWPNRDLNPGAIIALSPAVPAATKAVYLSWGKGKYDPRFNIDGLNKPVVIPPAYGLQGIHKITLHRRRRRDRVLEPLRGRDTDGRAGHLHRAAPEPRHHERHGGPGEQQAAGAAGLPAVAGSARTGRRQLRRGRRCAGAGGVPGQGPLRDLP